MNRVAPVYGPSLDRAKALRLERPLHINKWCLLGLLETHVVLLEQYSAPPGHIVNINQAARCIIQKHTYFP